MMSHERPCLTSLVAVIPLAFTLGFASCSTSQSPGQDAGVSEQTIDYSFGHPALSKMAVVYGGARLANLDKVQIRDRIHAVYEGQGYSPVFTEPDLIIRDLRLDFQAETGSFETWTQRWGHSSHTRLIVEDTQAATIDYYDKTFGTRESRGFFRDFNYGISRADFLIVRDIMLADQPPQHLRTEPYRGVTHDVFETTLQNIPIPVHVWLNSKTGHVSMVQMQTRTSYVFTFENWTSQNGITFAQNALYFLNGKLTEWRSERRVSFGSGVDVITDIAEGITQEPDRFTMSEMTTQSVSKDVYLVGRGSAYSVFYVTPEGIIGSGNGASFSSRLDAFRRDTNNTQPLIFQVVTHHHLDHLEGVADALEAGAILLVPETAVQNIEQLLTSSISPEQVRIIGDNEDIQSIRLFDVPSAHVGQNIVIFHSGSQSLFQADLYQQNFVGRIGYLDRVSLSLHQAVEALDLDVRHLLSAHSPKIESWTDFSLAAEQAPTELCPFQREICRGELK